MNAGSAREESTALVGRGGPLRPVYELINFYSELRFTGRLTVNLPEAHALWFDRGSVYFAETEADPPVAALLVADGLVTDHEIRLGTVATMGVESLAFVAERVPGKDLHQFRVWSVRRTERALSSIAERAVVSSSVIWFIGHPAGILSWGHTVPTTRRGTDPSVDAAAPSPAATFNEDPSGTRDGSSPEMPDGSSPGEPQLPSWEQLVTSIAAAELHANPRQIEPAWPPRPEPQLPNEGTDVRPLSPQFFLAMDQALADATADLQQFAEPTELVDQDFEVADRRFALRTLIHNLRGRARV